MEEQMIVFQLGDETYGVDVTQVRKIISMPEITAVPDAPSFIEGVIDVGHTKVPVVDLRHYFKLFLPLNSKAEGVSVEYIRGTSGQKTVIIVELNGTQMGLIVDKVTGMTRMPNKEFYN